MALLAQVNTQLRLDAFGRLDEDIPCAACEYNLRGLLPGQTCPECAAPIAEAIRRERMLFADPRWLKTLRTGIHFLLAAYCMPGLLLFVGGFIVLLGVVGVSYLLPLLSPIPWLAAAIGGWLVTTPDPRRADPEPVLSLRRIGRVALIALVPVALIFVASLWKPIRGAQIVLPAATISVLLSVAMVAILLHMRRLAWRMDSRLLIRATLGLAVAAALYAPALIAIVLVSWWNPLFINRPNTDRLWDGVVVGAVALGICLPGFAVWVAEKYRQRINQVLPVAQRRSAPPPAVAV